MSEPQGFVVHPLTAERWADFAQLMGERGGYGGCWCMTWRLSAKAFAAGKGAGNRAAMKALVDGGQGAEASPPGLLAYDGDDAVAWCSVAPRRYFERLESSRVLKSVDDAEVWSVSCFLVRKSHRKRGLSLLLLQAACDFVRGQGGRIIEGYPIAPTKKPYPAVYAWTGFHEVFLEAGFTEVLRRSDTRPIMRKSLSPNSV